MREVAERLGVCTATVYGLCGRGDLPHVRVSNAIRIRPVDVEDFLSGNEPEANDTKTYHNGVKVVPSFLLESDIVYADNIQSLLVDSGYWTEAEVASGQAD